MNENVNNNTNINNGVVNNAPVNTTVLPEAPVVTTTVAAPVGQSVSSTQSTSGAANGQILCDKCQSYYPSNQRYCMKCGNLNYSHPDNQSMKQYMNYDIKNNSFSGNYKDKLSHNSIDPEVRNKKLALYGSLFFSFFFPFLATILMFSFGVVDYLVIGICFGIGALLFLYNYSMSLIYLHAGEAWWSYYVPIYGQVVYYRITMDSGLMFFASLIPFIGQIISWVALYKLGSRSGKNGWLTLFFPGIMIPVIAFTGDSYSGSLKSMHMVEYTSDGKTMSEKDYKLKKNIISIIVIITLGVVLYVFRETVYDVLVLIFDFLEKCFHDTMEIINKYN